MKKHFYSHIIEIDSLTLELDKLDLSSEEKVHLVSIIESSLHHVILDAILSELTDQDKKIFLQHLASCNDEKIWLHLNSKIENIEEKIKRTAEDLKKDLHRDISDIKDK